MLSPSLTVEARAACDSHSGLVLHEPRGAQGNLPEQTLQGRGSLQYVSDHPPVFVTWHMAPVLLIACFYLGKPVLALRTKKEESAHG